MKTIEQQKEILKGAFAGIPAQKGEAAGEYREFAVPKIEGSYNDALEKALASLKAARPFLNWREGKTGAGYLRRTERTAKAMERLYAAEEGKFVMIRAQSGEKHRGKSVLQARAAFGEGEFGLGAYEIACILLTHPDLLKSPDDLWIDCAGDEYAPGGDGVFSGAPVFYFRDGRLKFDARGVGIAYSLYGSASGVCPQ